MSQTPDAYEEDQYKNDDFVQGEEEDDTGVDAGAEDEKAMNSEQTGDPSGEIEDLDNGEDVNALKGHSGPASNLRGSRPTFTNDDDQDKLVANAEKEDLEGQQ